MNFADIIELWPSMAELARDLSCGYTTVQQWACRDSIPSKYWPNIITAAKKRKLTVTLDMLFAAQQKRFAA